MSNYPEQTYRLRPQLGLGILTGTEITENDGAPPMVTTLGLNPRHWTGGETLRVVAEFRDRFLCSSEGRFAWVNVSQLEALPLVWPVAQVAS